MSDPEQCQCSLRTRVLGDGCQYCNPEMTKEIERENAEEGDA